jgi:glutathione peroxidase
MSTRRTFLSLLAGLAASPAAAQTAEKSRMTAYAFSFTTLDGAPLRLAAYSGRPVLVVNTASLCGYTPQYTGAAGALDALQGTRPGDHRRAVE